MNPGAAPEDGAAAPSPPPRRRRRTLAAFVLLALAAIAFGGLLLRGRAIVGRSCYLLSVWAPVAVRRSPEAVVSALEASGPVFIKLAQWLSTRRDLLSDEMCDKMGQLHERVRCQERPEDKRRAEAEIRGLRLGRLLGGGCIAQVYVGELDQGYWQGLRQVAVKVRREEAASRMDTDIRLLRWAARTAEWLRPDLQWLDMEGALDNFARYLTMQLDLRVEAKHLEHFRRDFSSGSVRKGWIEVPKVYNSTEAVLVSSLAHGVSLSHFTKETHSLAVKNLVFTALLDIMARMVLKNNFIHGDLHPGNVFVSLSPRGKNGTETETRPGRPTITLIDAGIAIEMGPALQAFARGAIKAAFRYDALALGQAVVQLHKDEGHCTHAENLELLERKMGFLLLAGCFLAKEQDKEIWGEAFDTYKEYRGSRVSEYFTRMMALLSKHKVRVAPSLWSLMTAFALIEGSVAELGFGVNVLRAATPYIFSVRDIIPRLSSWLLFRESAKRHKQWREQ